uniref:Uncharacterized protein n=1 Tax=Anguilla anguilla TaxID=7936 RepID=A0A0E9WV95_ANGAN
MPRSRSSGTTCAVKGCHDNTTRLNNWLDQTCYEHHPTKKAECSCPPWYWFHKLPCGEEEENVAELSEVEVATQNSVCLFLPLCG